MYAPYIEPDFDPCRGYSYARNKKPMNIIPNKTKGVFDKTSIPDYSSDDRTFTEDVIIYGNEMLNIGYYDFKDREWRFHTDTLIDMKEVDFKWMYPPSTLTKKTNK